MKKFLSILISSFVLSLCSNVYSSCGAAFYLGAEVGGCNLHYEGSDYAKNTVSVEDKGWAGRLIAGFDINRNVGIELGYTRYQDPTFKYATGTNTVSSSFSQQSLDILGKAMLPLTCNLDFFAKGGVAYVRRDDLTETIGNTTIKVKDPNDHLRPMLGVGLAYGFNHRVSGDIGYYRTFGVDDLEDADFYGAGITFRVG